MTHFTEDDLIALLDAPPMTNEHMASCTECRTKMDSFRAVMCGLKDESVWDITPLHEEPVPQTIANLRAFADQMAREDAQAETYVRDLLEGPRERWMGKLQLHPEYRTAGVVRKLIESTTHAIDTMPPDAVAMTALATEIADHLDPAAYTSDTVPHLRGAAWRERAYALFYTGAYADADLAAAHADDELTNCLIDEYDRARVGVVRALIDRSLERISTALTAAQASERTFAIFADTSRSVSAALARVHVLFSARRFDEALQILVGLEHALRRSSDAETHARVLANLGSCYLEIGKSEEALRHYEAASALFADLEIHTEAVRQRWNIASLLAAQGQISAALARFREVRDEFERIGMMIPSALVGLQIAEIRLADEHYPEVEDICQRAMRSFEAAGVLHTDRALTALAFLREAARNRKATPELACQVAEYLRRLPEEPTLLFAPQPSY